MTRTVNRSRVTASLLSLLMMLSLVSMGGVATAESPNSGIGEGTALSGGASDQLLQTSDGPVVDTDHWQNVTVATESSTNASITSVERSAEATELEPGESTTVTVDLETDETTDPAVFETFDPAFADIEIVDTDPVSVVSEVNDDTDELVAIWEDTDDATLEY